MLKNSILPEPSLIEKLTGICIAIRKLTPDLVRYTHNQNKLILTYACNVSRQLKQALKLKADVIMTDNPDWLVNNL